MIKAKKQVSDNEKTEACASFAIGMHKGVGIRTIDTNCRSVHLKIIARKKIDGQEIQEKITLKFEQEIQFKGMQKMHGMMPSTA